MVPEELDALSRLKPMQTTDGLWLFRRGPRRQREGALFTNFHSIGRLLSVITGLLVVVLLSFFANTAINAYRGEDQAHTVLSAVTGARDIMSAKLAVRGEMAIANLVLETPEAADPAIVLR